MKNSVADPGSGGPGPSPVKTSQKYLATASFASHPDPRRPPTLRQISGSATDVCTNWYILTFLRVVIT